MRARKLASRNSLASPRPVETQLSIQTRPISSYSPARAGRMIGSDIAASNLLAARGVPRANLARRQAHHLRDLHALPRQRTGLAPDPADGARRLRIPEPRHRAR